MEKRGWAIKALFAKQLFAMQSIALGHIAKDNHTIALNQRNEHTTQRSPPLHLSSSGWQQIRMKNLKK